MIRVGIDATSVSASGKGIDRVQRGTVHALAGLGRHELVVFARHPEQLRGVPSRRVSIRPTLAWEQVGLRRAAREVDVLLTWTERLPLRTGERFIVWLFEPPLHRIEQNRRAGARPWQRGSDLVTLALWRRSLRAAAVVLTGSQATAEAVRDVAPGARPLYPGLDPAFSAGSDGGVHHHLHQDPYVLHVGSSDPRDDTRTAIEAARLAGVRLVVAGLDPDGETGAEFVGRVSDERLVELYRGASAFLDTSLYEGFGYQVLEAMACGAPVVASATTSIPEVVGEAGLLCPPGDAGALAAALGRVLGDEQLAEDLRRRGRERAAEFTWARTVEGLSDAIEEAAR